YLSGQERAFLSRLINGTLERKIELDYIIDRFNRTGKRLKPVVAEILRLSVYQLLYMDAVPDRAAVNEAVKLAGIKGLKSLSGFINGILRTIAREKNTLRYPDKQTDYKAYLSVRYSIPEHIITLLSGQYDEETLEEIFSAQLGARPLYIRTNESRVSPRELKRLLSEDGIEVKESPLSGVFQVLTPERISDNSSFQKGLYYISDISSSLAVSLAGIRQGDRVLDVCAAPGGKTCHVLEILKGTGEVVSRDISGDKTALIRENIKRLNLTGNITVEEADARVFAPELEERFDVLIADLPCSGLGVIGRKNDINYRLTPDSFPALSALQREILGIVYRYLKVGGVLLYCTCTINRTENEDNRSWILQNLPFEPVPLSQEVPEELYTETAEEGYLKLLPGKTGTDGFFISKYRRTAKE
ncbi:MAG: 16S rRNA (cytosine(967)-C(5))-methyltransferase RsmB, partial [Lachnospiraceae bacterium]|nr:16S rRNA (cytosine(967)-C(5))-methyltransferase RsmB [Lachnospiraceae bacterium]